jgi:hypothetical protein
LLRAGTTPFKPAYLTEHADSVMAGSPILLDDGE